MDEATKQEVLRRIQLTRVLKDNFRIPFKTGRPIRKDGIEGRISKDDVLNLTILLNTCESFEEFLYRS